MYDESIASLARIGKNRVRFFNKLGVFSKRDVLFYIPSHYLKLVTQLKEGYIAIKINVIKKIKFSIKYIRIIAEFNGNQINLNFYNIKFLNIFYKDRSYYVCGNLYIKEEKYYMDSPNILNSPSKIIPIYKGVSSYLFSSIVFPLINDLDNKEIIYEKYTLKKIFFNLHNGLDIKSSLKALKYLEASFLFDLFNKMQHEEELTPNLFKILQEIPYELSNKQLEVCNKIESKLKKGLLKHFIYGEVGSGKTIISIISILMIIQVGYIAVFLAPTVTLAYQHYEEMIKIKPDLEGQILLLTSLSKNKKKLKENIQKNHYKIIIGTHALMYIDEIPNLGLIVIDEIHKFGVLQRSKLIDKAKIKNILMLTATPIPRSLSMIISKIMEYSTLQSFNKKNIKTIWVKEENIEELYEKIKNKKTYWVMPNIEENEKNKGIENRFNELSKRLVSVYMLHGKMKDSEKLAVIDQFKKNKNGVLVATTIIEIGLNIPDADIIIIENAGNFGLSQLHQLRGRVGRMGQESFCILVNKFKTKKIEYMKKYDNGFEISQKDLELRGGGKITGVLQHGCNSFYFLSEEDDEIFEEAVKDKKKLNAFKLFANSDISC